MNHEVPSDVWNLAEQYVSSGAYESEADVLRDALAALAQRREEEDWAAIKEGLDEINAGKYRSLEEFEAEFRREHNLPPRT
jgi:Arc/MetJ-type ribon-helix-helix transcriptional regulator